MTTHNFMSFKYDISENKQIEFTRRAKLRFIEPEPLFTYNKNAKCPRCGCEYTRTLGQVQLRSNDEGSTSMISCQNGCHNKRT
jgi:DNA-directed RNA polymerase subunit M/transcription elongation factor TFIIS